MTQMEALIDAGIDVLDHDPSLLTWQEDVVPTSYSQFQPRPNRPEVFDEQLAFFESKDQVSMMVGGNAAGTTEIACFKLAQFVLHQQEAPRKDTPFWIISNTYEQVCGTIWLEKLVGHGHIPRTEINERRIRWMSEAAQWPFTVPLLPWKNGDQRRNWMLEFKSYEQGRRALQARSIGGFFFSEQFPLDVFLETLRGCREYMYPGAQFAEFTPIEPDLCMWVEKLMDKPPPGWGFYRANTTENRVNLAEGWFDQFFAAVPDELLQTRLTGQLATYEGVIYEAFNPKVHIVGDDAIEPRLSGVFHYRGIDWGASVEHPFVTIWAYRDGSGDWFVYDEYWNPKQNMTGLDHIAEINKRWMWPEGSLYHCGTYADPSRPDMFNLFNQFGIPTQPGLNDVYKGIDTVRSLLQVNHETGQPKLFIHGARCPHLCEEMRKYRWLRGIKPGSARSRNPRTARPMPLPRDNDCVDALRYLLHTVESTLGLTVSSLRYKEQDQVHRAVQLALGDRARDQGWNRKATPKTIPKNTRFAPLLKRPTTNGNGNGNGHG